MREIKTFEKYARYYNLLYRDKNYAKEAQFVHQMIQVYAPEAHSILELGCGTGKHALHLAQKGYDIHGVDRSSAMIQQATAQCHRVPQDIASKPTFSQGDIRTLRMKQHFEVVLLLFHVFSYQTTSDDVRATLNTIRTHLKPEGIVMCDFWYGPAVLHERPTIRIKRMEDEAIRVVRIAEPILQPNENRVDVHYDIFIEDRHTGNIEECREIHQMRYFFLPEIRMFLHDAGLQFVICKEWMKDVAPGISSWGVYFVAKK